jgi:hypothetical protein
MGLPILFRPISKGQIYSAISPNLRTNKLANELLFANERTYRTLGRNLCYPGNSLKHYRFSYHYRKWH